MSLKETLENRRTIILKESLVRKLSGTLEQLAGSQVKESEERPECFGKWGKNALSLRNVLFGKCRGCEYLGECIEENRRRRRIIEEWEEGGIF